MSDDETICYIPAAEQYNAGKISFNEFVHHLFSHVDGTRHPEEPELGSFEVGYVDSFADSVEGLVRSIKEPTDPKPFEEVFAAYHARDLELVKARLSALGKHEYETTLSLALLALLDRRPDVLKFCMDGGMRFENRFIDVADSVDREKDPETWKVLNEDPVFSERYPRDREVTWLDRMPW